MSRARSEHYTGLLQKHYILDTIIRAEGCRGLPPHLKGPTNLQIGLNTPVRVDPLRVEDDGITAGLSFNRRHHEVFIPWPALLCVRADGDVVMVGPGAFDDTPPNRTPVTAAAPRHARSHAEGNVVRVDFAARRRASL
jgi:hypothetical protein